MTKKNRLNFKIFANCSIGKRDVLSPTLVVMEKMGVIRYDAIYEMKEVYDSQYRPSVSEVEWSEEPDEDFNSGYVEPYELIFEVRNVVLREWTD